MKTFTREFHLNKVNGWKNVCFNTQKRNQAVNDFEKDFYKLLNTPFYGKTMENVRNRKKVEIIKDDNEKIFKQQSALTFNGIHKSYENRDSYTFKQNEILMDKPIYIEFAVLELINVHMYETYYDKLQPYFREKNLQCHYMDGVTKDTPIMLKVNEIIKILIVDEIINEENWYQDDIIITQRGFKEFGDCVGIQVRTSGLYKYRSGRKYCWQLNNSDFKLIEKLQGYCKEIWKDTNFKKYDFRGSSQVYKMTDGKTLGRLLVIKQKKNIYRIRTKHGNVDVTDHSLLDKNIEINKPYDLVIGEELLHNHINFGELK